MFLSRKTLLGAAGGGSTANEYWWTEVLVDTATNQHLYRTHIAINESGDKVGVMTEQAAHNQIHTTNDEGWILQFNLNDGSVDWEQLIGYSASGNQVRCRTNDDAKMSQHWIDYDSNDDLCGVAWSFTANDVVLFKLDGSDGSLLDYGHADTGGGAPACFSVNRNHNDELVYLDDNERVFCVDNADLTDYEHLQELTSPSWITGLKCSRTGTDIFLYGLAGGPDSSIHEYDNGLTKVQDERIDFTYSSFESRSWTRTIDVDDNDDVYGIVNCFWEYDIKGEQEDGWRFNYFKWDTSAGALDWDMKINVFQTSANYTDNFDCCVSPDGTVMVIGFITGGGDFRLQFIDASDGSLDETVTFNIAGDNYDSNSISLTCDNEAVYVSVLGTLASASKTDRVNVHRYPLDYSITGTFGDLTIGTASYTNSTGDLSDTTYNGSTSTPTGSLGTSPTLTTGTQASTTVTTEELT